MNGFRVLQGGAAAAAAQAATLGASSSVGAVTAGEVENELEHRGYSVESHTPHVPVSTPTLTKAMAINVAIDEAIVSMNLPRTSSHYYRCPSGAGCPIPSSSWGAMIAWCVAVSNGYLNGQYGLPIWAKNSLHSGTLHGITLAGSGSGSLGGFADFLREQPWFLQSIGDTISNYGEFLTAQQVQAAIKANTAAAGKAFSKDDAMALVAALQNGGFIPAGKTGTVAEGANLAASPSWMMPLVVGGAVVVVLLLMKR